MNMDVWKRSSDPQDCLNGEEKGEKTIYSNILICEDALLYYTTVCSCDVYEGIARFRQTGGLSARRDDGWNIISYIYTFWIFPTVERESLDGVIWEKAIG